jgi:hypothetical protein
LQARIQLSGQTLQYFATAYEQLTHRTVVGLLQHFIQRDAVSAFIGGGKMLYEALRL